MARNRPPPPLLLAMLVAISIGDASGDAYETSICKPYTCGGVNISYPFYLSGKTADVRGNISSYCGYPGLGIDCVDGKYPMLKLGGDTEDDPYTYNVTSIDGSMSNFTISLVDPEVYDDENCQWVDHNVTVPSFMWLMNLTEGATRYLVFFANCSALDFFVPGQPAIQIEPIGCASSGDRKFFVVPSNVAYQTLSQQCQEVILVPVVQNANLQINPWNVTVYRNILNLGFQLEVNSSRRSAKCSLCEGSNNGRCAYSGTGEFVGCLCDNGRVEEEECTSDDDSGRRVLTAVIAGVTAAGVAVLAAVIFLFVMRKRKQKNVVNSSSKLLKYSGSGGTPHSRIGDMESGSIEDLPTHLFTYEELEEATNSFDENRELGDGGFGTVYKGYLKDGRVVAVKRLYNNSYRRVEQFQNEAAILSGLRHPNLVMFYGCTSSSSRELLLVYEFVANGTVADHLHGCRAPERALSWPLRLNIAVESAAALTYLHAIEPPVVHRDVKTTNILLDADYHVKVADFGLSRLFPLDVTHVSTAPQGTPGYI